MRQRGIRSVRRGKTLVQYPDVQVVGAMKMAEQRTHESTKILFIHKGGNQIRGMEQCLLALLRNINGRRIDPILVCTNEALVNEARKCNIRTFLFDMHEIMIDGTGTTLPLLRYLKSLWMFGKIIREERIDLIYCNGGLPCQTAVPVAKLLNIPVLCHLHHVSARRYYYLYLVRYANHVIFPSKFTSDYSYGKAGITGEVVFNGVNTSDFQPLIRREDSLRRFHAISDTDVVIGQVSAFTKLKRHDVLVAAFGLACQELDNLRLILVGEGPERKRIEEMVRARGLEGRIIFTGYVERAIDYFQQVIDINVLASVEEGLGIALLEASACGLPNIGADCTGIREAVRDNETGYLFTKDSMAELAARIVELAKDPQKRKQMGLNGRRYVESKFSENDYVTKIFEKIFSTIERHSSRKGRLIPGE